MAAKRKKRRKAAKGKQSPAPKRKSSAAPKPKVNKRRVASHRVTGAQRAAAMAAVLPELVPIAAKVRRQIAREAEKVFREHAPGVQARRFTTRQLLNVLLNPTWEYIREQAKDPKNIDPKTKLNPFWYHKE